MSKNDLKNFLETNLAFKLNNNQFNNLERLIFEIIKTGKITEEEILKVLKQDNTIEKTSGKDKFLAVKNALIKMRFPLTSQQAKIDEKNIFSSKLKAPLEVDAHPPSTFIPELIYIEKNAKGSYLEKRFLEKFSNCLIEEINHVWEYPKKHKFELKDLKRPLVFIVSERWDFIKPCPCTKNHLGCNYWIFNLGFGCPYDCSYCFLQQYANFPGIVLPANLDDFFDKFDTFYKKIGRPIRIGTGEFCDSLALDDITGYSMQLINFFRTKNVFFELKTKSNNIENILKCKPAKNIIISWSLNPQSLIGSEEYATTTLKQRIDAAKEVRAKGFSVAFHFDPVIYSPNWQNLYKQVIDDLYHELASPFSWISIGTLRGTRKLKNAAEVRFPQSNIFYGELFLGSDKKLRYPKFMRKEIYENMTKWIRCYDKKTPLYLCMEDTDCWSVMDKKLTSSNQIENYLLGNS